MEAIGFGEQFAMLTLGESMQRKNRGQMIDEAEPLPAGYRWCSTPGGEKFRVSGSISEGAEVWPAKASKPIKFPKDFLEILLSRFRGQNVSIGGRFDYPGRGSLGEFIQVKLAISSNPATYLAGLLIEEGYAETTGRGYARFFEERRKN